MILIQPKQEIIKMIQKLMVISVFYGIFLCLFMLFVLPYCSFLYKQLLAKEPEFFIEKNIAYYMAKLNSTQFIYYILLNYCTKIKDEKIRKKCLLIRNWLYVLLPIFFAECIAYNVYAIISK